MYTYIRIHICLCIEAYLYDTNVTSPELVPFCTNSSYTRQYRVIPGNRNWQIETADWNLDVSLDI